MKIKIRTYKLVESKSVFKISLWVTALTILGVYFWGLGTHHTFFENSLLSTSILAFAFFIFTSIGLYQGIKLKDTLGKITDAPNPVKNADFTPDFSTGPVELNLDIENGCIGALVSFLLWIALAILLSIALWIFSNLAFIVIALFAAMLYWIFFRALRLVFKNSNKSKGNLFESVKFGFLYTFLYSFWIYGIFVLTEYLKR
ncbi:MAG: hypothetical protein WAZ98_09455 [Cyclobacteriaceae bacterium]